VAVGWERNNGGRTRACEGASEWPCVCSEQGLYGCMYKQYRLLAKGGRMRVFTPAVVVITVVAATVTVHRCA
jgi:hypothetical protein